MKSEPPGSPNNIDAGASLKIAEFARRPELGTFHHVPTHKPEGVASALSAAADGVGQAQWPFLAPILYVIVTLVASFAATVALMLAAWLTDIIIEVKVAAEADWYWAVLLACAVLLVAELLVFCRNAQPLLFGLFEVASGMCIAVFGFLEARSPFAALFALVAGGLTIIDGRTIAPNLWQLLARTARDLVVDVCWLIYRISSPKLVPSLLLRTAQKPRAINWDEWIK